MNRFVWAGRAGLLWMALAIGTPALAAEPTLNQVYEAVHAGRLNQAHGMMTEVLRDHPDSAKAHYVEAEILAKEGRYGEAQGELNRAEQLAPGLPFAAPASVQELRGLIASAGARQAPIVGGVQRAIAPAAHERATGGAGRRRHRFGYRRWPGDRRRARCRRGRGRSAGTRPDGRPRFRPRSAQRRYGGNTGRQRPGWAGLRHQRCRLLGRRWRRSRWRRRGRLGLSTPFESAGAV